MKKISRRSFLFNAGSATTAAVLLPSIMSQAKNKTQLFDGKKLNVALVGLGNYAGILAKGLESSEYCRLAGIVTGHPAKAATWKEKYKIPDKNIYNYENFDTVSKNEDIDVIYVVLPNAMHKEYTIRAAKAGKHVICEKPMATTSKDCEEMIAACKNAGVQLAIGYRLHYEPYNLEIKRLGQQKVFGQVRLIESSLGYRTDDPAQWRLHKALSGGGPLMNVGIYCIQSSRYVLGEEPISVTAQFGPNTNPELFKEVEASITWQLQFPSGAVCNSSSTYNCQVDRFFASAENGQFELSPGISYGPFVGKTSDGPLHFPDINQQAAQLDGIGKLILAKQPLPGHITGEEGIKDVRIMEAIYQSAATGKKVSLV
ncbi:MAG TPA: Gfo/Idh/MocA family oxidoreductase [Puia sp.]|nr:Gfo/Idh/MocA family oxidoreductase [Puia sp.]